MQILRTVLSAWQAATAVYQYQRGFAERPLWRAVFSALIQFGVTLWERATPQCPACDATESQPARVERDESGAHQAEVRECRACGTRFNRDDDGVS